MSHLIKASFSPQKNCERAFLRTVYLGPWTPYYHYQKKAYHLVYEDELLDWLVDHPVATAIVSFQEYANGECIAVARLHSRVK